MSADLLGRRVLLTRSSEDNHAWADVLRARGIEPVLLPCIESAPLRGAAARLRAELERCDWLVLCSRRAVHALRELCGELPRDVKVACVGPATAALALDVLGRKPDRVSGQGTGRSLGVELAAMLPRSARVLVAAAEEGRVDVEDVLRPARIDVRRVPVYRTVPVAGGAAPVRLDDLRLDAVFLASPSAVRGLLNQALPPSRAAVVALGPTTAEAARAAGLPVHAEARHRGLEGLCDALARHLRGRQDERRSER